MSQHSVSDESFEPVERKVQLTGNSTFVVSLPKEWALERGLESGMSMYLYPHDDRVIAAPEHVSGRDRSVTIDATDGDEQALLQRVRAAYATGSDRITVTGVADLETDSRRELERTVGRLIGIEIQETTDDRLTVVNLLDTGEVSLPQTVAQARQLALELYDDAIEALLCDDDELARRVRSRDDDVDRLFAFVSRGFHRGLEDVRDIGRLGTDRTVAFREYRTARQLERLADHAGRIAAVTLDQSGPPDDALRDEIDSVAADIRRLLEAALSGEDRAASDAHAAVDEGLEDLTQRAYARCETDACLYSPLLSSLRQLAEIGLTIAETEIEAGLEE
ncbi:phosphate signaling complex PhoU family protein [Natronorubrum texcoconense]|uniref:Phosphate uptake regulator n=1 Tax=Natronorubrum texcoconense TaxID=1095776 RepID=A0A1G9F763_9EURY|nr:phosphate uptake regulator PhoU [Natronorubrum texcoconense]SDK83993.1 Phosphate uptake regulator [Natronorubrum texcoconense]